MKKRTLFFCIAGLVLAAAAGGIIWSLWRRFQIENAAIGIIGGADGPTQIYLAGGFGMFGWFDLLFTVAFVAVLGLILVTALRGLVTWNKNNHSPRLCVAASVVAKRMELTRHSYPNAGDATGAHGYSHSSSTWYYVTFEVESGDRMELAVPGPEYGMLVEGDRGRLSFQGTRYLSFERG